jgi:hypothetical protein
MLQSSAHSTVTQACRMEAVKLSIVVMQRVRPADNRLDGQIYQLLSNLCLNETSFLWQYYHRTQVDGSVLTFR